jgi:hypothetical protein
MTTFCDNDGVTTSSMIWNVSISCVSNAEGKSVLLSHVTYLLRSFSSSEYANNDTSGKDQVCTT